MSKDEISKDCIYIDESGEPGLKKLRSTFYTVGYIHTSNPEFLRNKLIKYLIRIQDKGRYPTLLKELKFYLPINNLRKLGYNNESIAYFDCNMQYIRKDVLNFISNYTDGVFIAVLNKKTIKYPTWTPERIGNYVIGHTLVFDVINNLRITNSPSVFYDEGRLSIKQTVQFEEYLQYKYSKCGLDRKFGHSLKLNRSNSVAEPLIWATDIVAGAYNHQHAQNNDMYTEIICNKVGIGLKKYWHF